MDNTYSLNSWSWNEQSNQWENLYDTCTESVPNVIPAPSRNTNLYKVAGAIQCIKDKPISQTGKNLTQTSEKYYPFATDSFSTGVVGFQRR